MCCAAPIPCAAPMPCVLEVFLRTGEDSHMHVSGAAELEMSTPARAPAWGTWGHKYASYMGASHYQDRRSR